ncbi:flagellar basal-body rod protein FlgB [Rhodovulum sp. ES.010]|uniref:FlgB family protein n=1 Tax=Rhodovulum sp. ES.010 TaxID=1882821 RepID=UPI00092B0919|nr:FlgB family protein [Rhodovulum sp. ES.010]SIO49900.1 flagellar basal-body rod protein FlgB [Rhodovulum sp. ES.010]
MFDKLEIFRMAQGLATHAGARQTVIARNVANADTPGYRARDIADFTETYRQSDDSMALRTTRAGHIAAADSGSRSAEVVSGHGVGEPNGNTVSLEEEMLKAAEVKSKHNLALAVYKSSLNVLRTSIGR